MTACLRFRLVAGLGLGVLMVYAVGNGWADVVIFKDGYILKGQVDQKRDVITDASSGQTLSAHTGPFFVKDAVRRITFSFTQVQHADTKGGDQTGELVQLTRSFSRHSHNSPNPVLNILKASPWDKHWERKLTVQSPINGQLRSVDIEQRITYLSPVLCRIDAFKYAWSNYYYTPELGFDDVRGLLDEHPDLMLKKDAGDLERRFKISRFLRQAAWYKEADDELARLLKDFPDDKQRLTEARGQIKGLRLLQAVEDLETAQRARRHVWLQQQLALFPKEGVEEAVQTRVRTLATKYEFINDALRESRSFLKELPGQLKEAATKTLFEEAAAKILEEAQRRQRRPAGAVPVVRPARQAPGRSDAGAIAGAGRDRLATRQGRPPKAKSKRPGKPGRAVPCSCATSPPPMRKSGNSHVDRLPAEERRRPGVRRAGPDDRSGAAARGGTANHREPARTERGELPRQEE